MINYYMVIEYTIFFNRNQLITNYLLLTEVIQTVVKLAARPHTPACIPQGFGVIDIPKLLENIINNVTQIPIERPDKIDLPCNDLICNPRKMAGAT